MTRQTSLDAYNELCRSGKANQQRSVVLKAVMDSTRPVTRAELEVSTGMRINCITGRVKELLELGWITETGRRECSVTGNSVYELSPVGGGSQLGLW